MSTQSDNGTGKQQRLKEAVLSYLRAVESGRSPAPRDYLARYPDLAAELTAFFAEQAQLDLLGDPSRSRGTCAEQPGQTPLAATGPYIAATGSVCPSGKRENSLPSPEVPGYRVHGRLGQGGMGVVYLAEQVALKRLVALKMIHAWGTADEATRARFQVEAQAVARFDHPNLVRVYDSGEHNGQPFVALEFVPGGSLAQARKDELWSPHDAAAVLAPLADAIAYAHQRGIVHRDLKPANVLLTAERLPKVSDFGLAKQLDQDRELTQTGQILGTPSYMAPEQAAGRSHEVGPLTDVHALGAILYYLLTGRPPFKGADTRQTLELVCTSPPVPPGQLHPNLPRDLETICLKCLNKEPQRRYASAAELAEDLRRFLDGRPILARPVTRLERAQLWYRQNRVIANFWAVIVAILLIGSTASWVLSFQYLGKKKEAENNAFTSDQNKNSAEKNAQEANRNAEKYRISDKESRQRLVQRLEIDANIAQEPGNFQAAIVLIVEALRQCQGDPVAERRLRLRLAALLRQCPRPLHAWFHTGRVREAAFSDSGKRVVTIGDDQTVRVWDTNNGQALTPLLRHSGSVRQAFFSSGGDRLLTVSKISSEQPPATIIGAMPQVSEQSAPAEVRVWDVAAGTCAAVWKFEKGLYQASFDRAGRRVVSVYRDSPAPLPGFRQASFVPTVHVRVWDATTGRPISSPWQQRQLVRASFLPDSNRILLLSGLPSFFSGGLWDIGTGRPVADPAFAALQSASDVFVSSDGRRMLAVSLHGDTAALHEVGRDGHSPRHLRHGSIISSASFSPEGGILLTRGKNGVRLWDTATGTALTPVLKHDGFLPPSFSADGHRFLTFQSGNVKLWDTRTGQPPVTEKQPRDPDLSEPALVRRKRPAVPKDQPADQKTIVQAPMMPLANGTVPRAPNPAGVPGMGAVGLGIHGVAGAPGLGVQGLGALGVRGGSVQGGVPLGMAGLGALGGGNLGNAGVRGLGVQGLGALGATGVPVQGGVPVGVAGIYGGGLGAQGLGVQGLGVQGVGAPGVKGGPVHGQDGLPAGIGGFGGFGGFGGAPLGLGASGRGKPVSRQPGMGMFGNLGLSSGIGAGFHGGVADRVIHVAFRPGSRELLTVTDRPGNRFLGRDADESVSRQVRVWQTATARSITTPLSHEGASWQPLFSPDGRHLLCLSHGGALLWDLMPRNRAVPLRHTLPVRQLRVSPDGRRLVTVSSNTKHGLFGDQDEPKSALRAEVRLWDLATGSSVLIPAAASVQAVEFSADGRYLLINSLTGLVGIARVWDAATGKAKTQALYHRDPFHPARLSPDGKRVLFLRGDADIAGAGQKNGLPPSLVGPGGIGQGTLVIVGDSRNGPGNYDMVTRARAQLWDIETDQAAGPALPDAPAQSLPNVVAHAWFSPDGRRVFTACADQTLRVWDAASGREVLTPLAHKGLVSHAAVSPDGRRIVTVATVRKPSLRLAESVVQLWDAATGKPLGPEVRYPGSSVMQRADFSTFEVSFSADSRRLLIVCRLEQKAQVVDAGNGQPLGRTHRGIREASFGPTGSLLTIGQDARLWDVERDQPLTPPLRHDGLISHGAFQPAAGWIVTVGYDNVARVWDTASGQPLGPPLPHVHPGAMIALGVEGKQVFTLVTDSTVQAWNLQPEDRPVDDLLRLARVVSGRQLDDSGSVAPLSDLAFRQELEAAQRRWPEEFRPVLADIRTWHEREAATALETGSWSAAVFHLERLLRLQPDSAADWARRGRAHARLGAWDRAVADYAEALKRNPHEGRWWSAKGIAHLHLEQRREAAQCFRELATEDAPADVWADYALVCLSGGNRDGYRQACAHLVKRFREDAANPAAWSLTLKTCSYGPDGVDDFQALLTQKSNPAAQKFGAAAVSAEFSGLYRLGRFQELTFRAQSREPLPQLYGAMAWQRLGDGAKARKILDFALPRAELVLYGKPKEDYEGDPLPWRSWLELEAVCREARQLIKESEKK